MVSKYTTFIPTPMICTPELTIGLVLKYIVEHFEIPKNIISGMMFDLFGTF